MKSDLFTSIAIFIVGVVMAFVACNMIMPGIEDFSFETINLEDSASLADPDPEIFNYRAINPTVEVYIGDNCEDYDENGKCIDNGVVNTDGYNADNGTNKDGDTGGNTEEEDDTGIPGENEDGATN